MGNDEEWGKISSNSIFSTKHSLNVPHAGVGIKENGKEEDGKRRGRIEQSRGRGGEEEDENYIA